MSGSTESEPAGPDRVLLDTHALVWALMDSTELSGEARRVIETAYVVASVASLWELVLKSEKPSALLTDPVRWWTTYLVRAGIRVLGIRQSHVLALGRLPAHNRDPFDRILVAQAMVEGVAIVSKDRRLMDYGVPVVW